MSPRVDEVSDVPVPAWRLALRAAEVRLRFVLLLLLLGAVMAAWPWLRAGVDRLAAWGRSSARGGDAVSADVEFFCPMDPGVDSNWPAICPICHMDLIPRSKSDCVLLPEGVVARMQFTPYRVKLAGVATIAVEPAPNDRAGAIVPISSIVHHADVDLVYVETMPGTFDGVPVQLGETRDGRVEVVSGLKVGQRAVAIGAFLVDAESRLNPALATGYFGATSQHALGSPPPVPKRRAKSGSDEPELSPEDRALVEKQRICPVTEAPLGSMGTPVARTVRGRKVFLCCEGCETRLFEAPDECLAKIDAIASEPADAAPPDEPTP